MMDILFVSGALLYAAILLFFGSGIIREIRRRKRAESGPLPLVSVLIPARNEESGIEATLESLRSQDYPPDRFEVLIIDDRSADGTAAIAKNFIDRNGLTHFRLLRHQPEHEGPTYKKNALSYAMRYAAGEIIMTTDADCRVQRTWISSMVSCYDSETGLVAGLITFGREDEKNLFHRLQTLEFAGLVFTGVGAIGNGYPIICNGSNLSYRRRAFDEVGGYQGHQHLPSGDDDLLMQNLHHQTGWKIRYNLAPESVNFTHPVDTPAQFFHQRARWASKGSHYPDPLTTALLVAIYLLYLTLLFSLPLTLLGVLSPAALGAGWAAVLLPEMGIMYLALRHLKRKDLWPLVPLAKILQVPYIVIAGLAGFFSFYQWKETPETEIKIVPGQEG